MTAEQSLVVRHSPTQPAVRTATVKATEPPGLTVSELVLQTAELRYLAGDLGKVTYRLCVDGQGRVCGQSGSSVQFTVDYAERKPIEETPACEVALVG